jgi:hypothetical protein
MRALTVLVLIPLVACGGSERYFVRANPKLDEGPIVMAVNRDGALVGLQEGTFARTTEPAPAGKVAVKGLGVKHPMAKTGLILIGVGLLVGVGLAAGLSLGSFNYCGDVTEGGTCSSAGSSLLALGLASGVIGDAMWITGIGLAAAGASHGPEILLPPPTAAQTVPLAGFRF